MSLLSELKRRNVFRVAILYVVAGWLLLQCTDLLAGAIGADWVYRFLAAIWIICFPLLLVFAWIYEITPEGIRKERDVARERSITVETGKRINRAIVVSLALALGLLLIRLLLR